MTAASAVATMGTPKKYKRMSIGAIIGGVVGAAAGGPVGAAIGVALGGGAAAVTTGKAVFGGEAAPIATSHAKVFRDAMTSMREPGELRTLAKAFDDHGHRAFATLLRKRANTRELSPEEKKMRREAFRAAMSSDEPGKIVALAAEFEGEGSVGAANDLYEHARAVRAALAAGARARPVNDLRMVEQLGDRLGKAIIHYGAESPQAASAAANFLRARGVAPTDEALRDVLTLAKAEIMAEYAPPAEEQAPEEEPAPDPAGPYPLHIDPDEQGGALPEEAMTAQEVTESPAPPEGGVLEPQELPPEPAEASRP